jgi:hypothetical protein
LVVSLGLSELALSQGSELGSPYGSFGIGDLLHRGQVTEALMGGVGIGFVEPVSVLVNNPATYAFLDAPSLQGSARAMFLTQRTQNATSDWSDGRFDGLSLGVPFGRGKWGMALGMLPFSDVAYSLDSQAPFVGGTAKYEYRGTGGVNRAFAGVSRVISRHAPDSLGNHGHVLSFGANFDFLFGSVEQSRKSVYPAGSLYMNTSAYSSLVLRAPTANAGFYYEGQLIPLTRVAAAIKRKADQRAEELKAWRDAHPGETPANADKRPREASQWRFGIGATVDLPAVFNATRVNLVTTFLRGSSGLESTFDTVAFANNVTGTLSVPLGYGFGVSVRDARWMITAELRQRDWSALSTNIEGYQLPTPLRSSSIAALGARYTPAWDGNLLQRITYRAGVRYTEDYLEVNGAGLNGIAASLGLSVPVNAAQTNSRLHLGAEWSQRGRLSDGQMEESGVTVLVGVSITPWKRERWFRRYQIQ